MTNINVQCDCYDKTNFKMNEFYNDKMNLNKVEY